MSFKNTPESSPISQEATYLYNTYKHNNRIAKELAHLASLDLEPKELFKKIPIYSPERDTFWLARGDIGKAALMSEQRAQDDIEHAREVVSNNLDQYIDQARTDMQQDTAKKT